MNVLKLYRGILILVLPFAASFKGDGNGGVGQGVGVVSTVSAGGDLGCSQSQPT
jgi:hypothetical protein